jgi:uncharacterized protein (TIGR02996 family)
VGAEDQLDWLDLEYLLDAGSRMSDDDYGNWEEFRRQHEPLIGSGPAEMMRTVANRLGTLLSGFREHVPFLRGIKAAPEDELEYAVYADWLESRGDRRGHLLRLYIKWAFHPDESTLLAPARGLPTNVGVPEEMSLTRQDLIAAIRTTPAPWLYQVFGSPERFRRFRREIEAARGISKT